MLPHALDLEICLFKTSCEFRGDFFLSKHNISVPILRIYKKPKFSVFDHIVKIEFSKLYNAGRVLKGAFSFALLLWLGQFCGGQICGRLRLNCSLEVNFVNDHLKLRIYKLQTEVTWFSLCLMKFRFEKYKCKPIITFSSKFHRLNVLCKAVNCINVLYYSGALSMENLQVISGDLFENFQFY